MDSTGVRRSRRRKKEYAVQQFGGKCQLCGYDKCMSALEFHHIDENGKRYEPTTVILGRSWENAVKELEKCILVCANCHREVHFDKIDKSYLAHAITPFVKMICETCGKEVSTKREEQKYCSPACADFGRRKSERPTKDELKVLLETENFSKIGRMFDVSDNAVRKWARRYDLIK